MRIAIIGYGKMGRAIEQIADSMGHEAILTIGSQNRSEMTAENLSKADVAIEFSRPETAFENIVACLRAGVPVVSGTTGWLDQLETAKQVCAQEKGAFFYASNFSVGVNIFFELSRQLAAVMNAHPAYDMEMEEVHHTQKLDYPSGTAITLAKGILENWEKKSGWASVLSEGEMLPENESEKDFRIVSKRQEGVPGTHQINWFSEIDSIEIKHTAHSREGFVRGALSAAEWLVGKTGYFEMKDFLAG